MSVSHVTRRDVLQLCGLAAVGCTTGPHDRASPPPRVARVDPPAGPARPRPPGPGAPIDDGALDEVLEMLHAAEPKAKQGLSTHAPMVAEALCVLGHSDRAKRWVEAYRAPVLELPAPGRAIARERWRDALGPNRGAATWEAALARWGDWRQLFVGELRDAPWRDVLDLWVARLAPGISAAATHGVIRTAHAARGLARRETAPRRAELARGLAYWAAAYEELPARAPSRRLASFDAALAQLPRYRDRHGAAPGGNIVSGLRAVATLDGVAEARDAVVMPGDLEVALSDLSSTFARVYLQQAAGGHAIAFVHAITGPCALRRIAPHVTPATAGAALPYAWQAAAAIHAAYARREVAARRSAPEVVPGELIGRAIDNGDDHAIKLTEVLVAEHALRPDPAYLAAADDAIARL
jgi:hypothetical protein